ncbi:amino acid permease [Mammaliicoccus stepanovicii]|uniref:D-serine/D-alanine/glycine transporter n=1 Tax=Mammaliicoccus stepanovicii TaxID=643214 RepID=A0A239Z2Q1_9STAP|nr:amino acid permease [Mammaliicoccus stepanovicii]PNZ78095.1 gamma-aminobutyrate permease [Mammaliicoccus stepanovicii]GGI40331.1 D-serine/D-alanine/glycine transporter [Mammaliicoccus stepanovicii]SNV64794.1 D-serine/D-alanine/glycine transporter [Mammaliicoccus stepanovicii]
MSNNLQRELSNRHVQLIAIGGAIGTGLFLGAGETIHAAGPSILLTYIIIGFILFMFMRALGEILLSNTDFHSFADVTHTYIGPYAGYITGWTYWFCWIVTGMAEVTAVAKYVNFWFPDIPTWITALFTILVLMTMNLMTAKLFGELEFWFSIIKITTIIALIVVGIIMLVMAYKTPYGTASITHIWSHGGFFPNGINGFFLSFQMATFAFVGIELIGVTAGETKDPHTTIPKAINSVPIRIMLFYVGSLIIIMSITPWNKIDPSESPFVTLFGLIGIPIAAALINFVVLTAAASSCNSGIFSNSRMLYGLSQNDQANKGFGQTNKRGVPYKATLFSCSLLMISVILNYVIKDSGEVFKYVTSVSTVLFLVVWSLITIAYIRYRKISPELNKSSKFKLPGGVVMAWITLIFFIFVFILLMTEKVTLIAILITPIWFILLTVMYFNQKRKIFK